MAEPIDHLDELVRLKVLELRRLSSTQAELIVDMRGVGFGNSRIAELLGTTPNAVNVTLQKAKSRKKPGKQHGDVP